ncbi:MAG: DNA primase large subunit PriL [Thermoproteales archaeon]|nr:DNA primase large subunit PriL [Thermoproteales archaeon]
MLRNSIIFTLEDIAKYPFSKDAVEYIRSIDITLRDLDEYLREQIFEKSYRRVASAIEEKRIVSRQRAYLEPRIDIENLDIEILSFPVAILLVKLMDDPLLASRYSIAESKRAAAFLKRENDEKIIYLATTTFNWNVSLNSDITSRYKAYAFMIDFPSYLKNVPEYSPKWKLVNRILYKGNVLLTKQDLVRLMEEAIKDRILQQVLKRQNFQLPEDAAAKWVNKIEEKWKKYRSRISLRKPVKLSEDAYPPCIVSLIEDVKAGKNISHAGRFVLAAFLINIGMSPDEVLEIFKSSPDFNESIARYQVEHIAGLRGSRIRYSPFKCENMKSYGLCRYDDVLCKGIKHPLQFYYKRASRRRYGDKIHEN